MSRVSCFFITHSVVTITGIESWGRGSDRYNVYVHTACLKTNTDPGPK